jgi:hypothetical protein
MEQQAHAKTCAAVGMPAESEAAVGPAMTEHAAVPALSGMMEEQLAAWTLPL